MKVLKYIVRFFTTFLLFFTLYTSIILFLFKFINPPTTAFIQQTKNSSITNIISTNFVSQSWAPIKSISNNIILAVVASEDQRFFEHFGLDLVEVEKVIEKKIDGGRVRGASTITQQTAKNLFLFPQKIILRKGIEVYYSFLMEMIWGKKRILEVYLNIAQFGQNIFGVDAASEYYFNKPAQYLTVEEAAQLAAILPNPTKLDLNLKTNYLKNRIDRIIKNMCKVSQGC